MRLLFSITYADSYPKQRNEKETHRALSLQLVSLSEGTCGLSNILA
jgi:hypothetical protein